jgi:putative ATPase
MERTELKRQTYTPLAARLRPKTLREYVGHADVVGKDTALRRAIEAGTVGSLILWGPPGVGKTTLAYLIAAYIEAKVERMSAVEAGVKELRDVIARAREWQKIQTRTVLIIDEIHRFNKAQQDVLLPAVEEGLITLIGATTENPYFEVVKALISRAQVIRLQQLSDKDIGKIVDRAAPQKIEKNARAALIRLAGGDARRALNILEQLLQSSSKQITVVDVEAAAQQTVVQYDKAGDAHYDTISAYIKSLRGSDPDAALFYLFRMLVAGEDPKFIIRRLFIFASEDIGNADPHALMVVAAASQALEWVGLPEAEFALAHATIYTAAAPKSNSVYTAMTAAKEDIAHHGNATPPDHITNAPIADLKKHGKGVGYKYPHDYPDHLVAQQYRPDVVQGNVYYQPGDEGFEKEVKKRVERARKLL